MLLRNSSIRDIETVLETAIKIIFQTWNYDYHTF
jgi:hypothetical protein